MPFQVTKDPVVRACCVPVCNNQKFNLTHKFPVNDNKCSEWLLALDIPKLYKIPKQKLIRSYFICTRHFRDDDYRYPTSRYLNANAVPSINIKDLSQLDLIVSRWDYNDNAKKTISKQQNEFEDVRITGSSPNMQDIEINVTLDNEYLETNEIDALKIYLEIDENSEIDQNYYSTKTQNLKRNLSKSSEDIDLVSIENKKCKPPEIETAFHNKEILNNKDDNSQIFALDDAEGMQEIHVQDDSSILTINHSDYEEKIYVNLFWLRDHCKCDLCYNHEMHQRKTNILEIPLDIEILQSQIENGKLYIIWQDEHESEYDLEFLYQNQYKNQISMKSNKLFLWNNDKFNRDNNKYAEMDFGSFLSNEKLTAEVVESIVKFGIAFIKNVPPTTDMTELTIKRLFPIQKTLFGEMWTFTSNKDRADTAYTTEYLGPHTDNTYFCDPAGLQVFHCIKFDGDGGDSIFVDGFNAIKELKNEDPEALNILSTINVPAEYIDKDQHHKHSAPIIQIDPVTLQPNQIRFNLYDRSDFNEIELSKIKPFYRSLKKLTEILNDEKNILKYKLMPGTVVIFDNWRILHGREAFSGVRVMTGCYVSRTDFMSKARSLKLLQ